MNVDGNLYKGRLTSDGRVIWSDGDIWLRAPPGELIEKKQDLKDSSDLGNPSDIGNPGKNRSEPS